MTSADKWVAVGALLFGLLIAWLFSITDALVATGALCLLWLCLSRRWLTLSRQCQVNESEIVTQNPFGLRLFSGLLALLFGGFLLFCLGAMWGQMPPLQWLGLGAVVSAFFGPLTWLFLWVAGPDETRFDLHRERYRRTAGFPLFPKTSFGSFDEIAGVYVAGPDRQQQCRVVLVWKEARRKRSWLADVSGKEAADAVMRQIAEHLQVPCGVDALAQEQTRNAWAEASSEGELVFRKPRSYGIFGGVLMALTGLLPLWVALDRSTHWTGGIIPSNPALSFTIFPCGPCFLFGLSLASPSQLQVDLNRRSYRYGVSILGIPRRYAGTFDDFAALVVEKRGKQSSIYSVFLNWRARSRPRQLLGEFDNPEEAESQRRQIAQKLGVAV